MSAILPYVRFVRQIDLQSWGLGDRLRVNPRTRYAEGRAGLSWTGTRDYVTPQGKLRVLRRPSQVEAPGHLRTLRRLPLCPGHPSDDRDVLPRYTSELFAGSTGDEITIERVGPWSRPVADLTVIRPDVFCEMMPLAQWRDYCRDYPEDCEGVTRGIGPAKTGTSLGYNALWCSPFVQAEIVEDNEGALVGSWLGPDGKQHLYDVEHVVDPDCELVLRLQREESFDPLTLGGQHFAIKLDAMTGRGGEQSELLRVGDSLRVVDSREIIADPTRGRVQFQVPRATTVTDMQWTVGASRDLPFEEGERAWDGAAAEASIFDGAGWPDSPDPDGAKLGFLAYDADAPELKGSYKFPFARRGEDGRLRVPKSALEAAASMLPKATTLPQEVRDRMQAVIDHYNERYERAAETNKTQDAQEQPTMTKQNVVVGVRDSSVSKFMQERKLKTIADLNIALDMIDASKLEPKLAELMEGMAALMEMVKMAEDGRDMAKQEAEDMKGQYDGMVEKMKDMPDVEAKMKELAELKGKMKGLEDEIAAAKAAAAKATSDAATKIDELSSALEIAEKELAPIRAEQLKAKAEDYVKLGLDEKTAKVCDSMAALQRAFAASLISPRYGEQIEVEGEQKYVKTSDDVGEAIEVYFTALGKHGAAGKANDAYTPGPGLALVPTPNIVPPVKQTSDARDGEASNPNTGTSSRIAASCE